MSNGQPHFPGTPLITAYGNGGFRFADMSHKGSLLFLPSGVYSWPVTSAEHLSTRDFASVFAEITDIDFLILGTGNQIMLPPETLRAACSASNTSVEAMTTGAAVRTYNIVISEKRMIAAALICVGGDN